MSFLASLFLLLTFLGHDASAVQDDLEACLTKPQATDPCVIVNVWEDFLNIINEAQSSEQVAVTFCPFDVTKTQFAPAEIFSGIVIKCRKTSPDDTCMIRGAGEHIRIYGDDDTVVQGISFHDSDEHAVKIDDGSPVRIHSFCDCEFHNNKRVDQYRGGAFKTEKDTGLVNIISCVFRNNFAKDGGAIYSRSNFMYIVGSSFYDNMASSKGAAIFSAPYAGLSISSSRFSGNQDGNGRAITVRPVTGDGVWIDGGDNVSTDNGSCDGFFVVESSHCQKFVSYSPDSVPSLAPSVAGLPINSPSTKPLIPSLSPSVTDMPTSVIEYTPGNMLVYDDETGLSLAEGLSIRMLAQSGSSVSFTSEVRSGEWSSIPFHEEPDGAGVVATEDGGWLYVSNSEMKYGLGGVFVLSFDEHGEIHDYQARLQNTTRNCNGGLTAWNTWISCEEHASGQCFQVDPLGVHPPEQTVLGEPEGGNFEAFTYDNRNLKERSYFITEDHAEGALRRFRPDKKIKGEHWDVLHGKGKLDYLVLGDDHKFEWSKDLEKGRASAAMYFPNAEGIVHKNGILYFVSKRNKTLFVCNLDTMQYYKEATNRQTLLGGGEFASQPDHLVMLSENVLYLTEDGGSSVGLYGRDTLTSRYFAIVEDQHGKFVGDEITGLAFSPDKTRMYLCMQDAGKMFEIRRQDGKAFEHHERQLHLKL